MKIKDNKCTNVIVPSVLKDNNNDIDKEPDDNVNFLVTQMNLVSIVPDPEFNGMTYSNDAEEGEFKDCNNNKSNDKNSSYLSSAYSTSNEALVRPWSVWGKFICC